MTSVPPEMFIIGQRSSPNVVKYHSHAWLSRISPVDPRMRRDERLWALKSSFRAASCRIPVGTKPNIEMRCFSISSNSRCGVG